MILTKMAALLDALADADDARAKAPVGPDPLVDRLESKLGSQVSASLRSKLAGDAELREALTPIIEAPEAPRSLGGPAEKQANSAPTSKAERMRAAEEEFAQRVMSFGRG